MCVRLPLGTGTVCVVLVLAKINWHLCTGEVCLGHMKDMQCLGRRFRIGNLLWMRLHLLMHLWAARAKMAVVLVVLNSFRSCVSLVVTVLGWLNLSSCRMTLERLVNLCRLSGLLAVWR